MLTAARKGELFHLQLFKREVDKGREFAGTGVGVWETLQILEGIQSQEKYTHMYWM